MVDDSAFLNIGKSLQGSLVDFEVIEEAYRSAVSMICEKLIAAHQQDDPERAIACLEGLSDKQLEPLLLRVGAAYVWWGKPTGGQIADMAALKVALDMESMVGVRIKARVSEVKLVVSPTHEKASVSVTFGHILIEPL